MSDQLISPIGYDVKDLCFSDPVEGSIPNMQPPVTFHRINVKTKLSGGGMGDLLIPTSMLYSFGVQKNENPDTGKVTGYSMPLCMWNRDGATDEEKAFTDMINNVVDKCKEHLLNVKDDIGKYDLEAADLKKLNPLWFKRERGKIVEGKGPVLYPKLVISKKDGDIRIMTPFTDNTTGADVNPIDIIDKHANVQSVIKVESIFIGNKISLQVKLDEALVSVVGTSRPRRLRPQVTADPTVSNTMPMKLNTAEVEEMANAEEENNSESDKGSDISESESEEEVPVKKPARKVVRKKVVKK